MKALCAAIAIFALSGAAVAEEGVVRVGSKSFTESVVLGEIAAALVRDSKTPAKHLAQLGGTRVLFSALQRGEIDVYAEYTGTITEEILRAPQLRGLDAIRDALEPMGVRVSRPLGFNDTYALGMKSDLADRLGIRTISDLVGHPELVFGFTNEFMDRGDGWPGLRERYRLPQTDVRGLDHDLAYRGLAAGTIQVSDLYSTDADIRYYNLRVLVDDLHYFPEYQAVWLTRSDLEQRAPNATRALASIEGRIGEREMIGMNARAKLDRVPETVVAADFLSATAGVTSIPEVDGIAARIGKRTWEHLALVVTSLAAAILIAIPLGILAALQPRAGQGILGIVGILQTVPSLALLVFLIPLLGIGSPPAVVALFLYSLLPIVRNTHAGLRDIPLPIRESAAALGLPTAAQLRLIELPLASSTIVAGIKTSAVINVGTATLGALVGAGGYGQPILTGIRLDDVGLILEGAVPAAAMALLAQVLFEACEHAVVPRGLRLKS